MAQNQTLVLRCVNPECAKPIKMNRPQKSGVYTIGCPHCERKFKVRIPGMDAQAAGNAEEKKAETPDFSKAAPKSLGDDFKVGIKYELTCPHCNKRKLGFQSDKPVHKSFACPLCKGPLEIDIRQVTKVVGPESTFFIRGKLTLLRKGWFNKEYPLREGRNVIGRADASAPSDISIKGDNTMSRRSVSIDMLSSEKGYTFKLTVLKAANPVIHNGSELMTGESISLNFGDTIVLGSTKFRFDRDN